MRRRGMVVLLSDLLVPLARVRAARWRRCAAAGHEVVVFQLLDPAERTLALRRAHPAARPGVRPAAARRSGRPRGPGYQRALERTCRAGLALRAAGGGPPPVPDRPPARVGAARVPGRAGPAREAAAVSFLYPLFLAALGGWRADLAAPGPAAHPARAPLQLAALPARPPRPRFESRQRIEHWLLLALRCLAIALLAAAFARPLFTRPLPGVVAASGRRVLVLLDTSASMRREGLWEQALGRARAQLQRARGGRPGGGARLRPPPAPLVRFEEWAEATPGARGRRCVATRLHRDRPRLGGHRPGRGPRGRRRGAARRRGLAARPGRRGRAAVVLVSDLQQGSRLVALGRATGPAGCAS